MVHSLDIAQTMGIAAVAVVASSQKTRGVMWRYFIPGPSLWMVFSLSAW